MAISSPYLEDCGCGSGSGIPNNPYLNETGGHSPEVKAIDQRRVLEKLDDYMARRDYAGAERHLKFWLAEARMNGDRRGELLVLNELVGHYRKTGEKDNALEAADAALGLLDSLDYGETVSAGTTCINAATALSAFGENERALPLFRRARKIYESGDGVRPELLGGLYNNTALCCAALGYFEEAMELYDRAMAVMQGVQARELEQAITCLNRADAIAARDGLEAAESAIYDLLDEAAALLHTPGLPKDGYTAFVMEKCAPSFAYYGYFAESAELKKEAEALYAGT